MHDRWYPIRLLYIFSAYMLLCLVSFLLQKLTGLSFTQLISASFSWVEQAFPPGIIRLILEFSLPILLVVLPAWLAGFFCLKRDFWARCIFVAIFEVIYFFASYSARVLCDGAQPETVLALLAFWALASLFSYAFVGHSRVSQDSDK